MCLLLPVTPCVVPLCVSGCCGSCCCPWCFCACCWSLSSSCWCWRCVSGFRAAGTLGGREMVVPRWPSSTPTAMPVAGGKGCSGVQSGLYRTGKADEYILMTFFFKVYSLVCRLSLTGYWFTAFTSVLSHSLFKPGSVVKLFQNQWVIIL